MQISDFVELINDNEELRNKNIFKGISGFLVSYIDTTDEWIVKFLDDNNWGAYAVAKVKTKDLNFLHSYPQPKLSKFHEQINMPDFYTHTELKLPKFKEYDFVKIINNKPEYEKHGVKKGMTGCIASTYAINGEWNVLVSLKPWKDADIEVHEDDMELIDISKQ
ncbi:MAG: hypothetical protein J1F36_05375 [Clostridiales bacterium]|nr:hypothetical protein [Clostridiales bacterium]